MKWGVAIVLLPPLAFWYHRLEWKRTNTAGYMQAIGLSMVLVGFALLVNNKPHLLGDVLSASIDPPIFDSGISGSTIIGHRETQLPERNVVDDKVISSQVVGASGNASEVIVTNNVAAPVLYRDLKQLRRVVKAENFYSISDLNDSTKQNSLLGNLHDRLFIPTEVKLIDGVLRIKQGVGFYGDREILVFLSNEQLKKARDQILIVSPGDSNPPSIHLSWQEQSSSVPQTQIFSTDYWMELKLNRIVKNKIEGFIRLMVSDDSQSHVVGRFSAYTDELRYLLGEVNTNYNSDETIEYVAEQYVNSQLDDNIMRVISYRNTLIDYFSGGNRASTEVLIELKSGRKQSLALTLEKSSRGWSVEPTSQVDFLVAEEATQTYVLTAKHVTKSAQHKAKAHTAENWRGVIRDYKYFLSHLHEFEGRVIQLALEGGKFKEGRFIRENSGNLVLKTKMTGGYMEQFVPKHLVVSARLVLRD